MTSGNVVNLTNDTLGDMRGNGSAGNVTISSGPSGWTFTGMSGGRVRDCTNTTGCTSNDDCASGSCDVGGTDRCIP